MSIESGLLSIVIPVYNSGQYLVQCMDSVLGQTYSNIEVLLLNDGSSDESWEICNFYEKRDKRVKVMSQSNQGVAVARRNAARQARGKYMVFIDSDDYIEKDYLENLVAVSKGYDLVTSGYVEEKNGGEVVFDKIEKGEYVTEEKLNDVIDHMIIYQSLERGLTPYIWNKLFCTDLANKVLEVINASVYIGEDSEFLYRYVLECGSVLVTDICGYHYCQREQSLVHSKHEDYLVNLNELYLSLKEVFMKHCRKDSLMWQLQVWTGVGIRNAPLVMGFSDSARAVVTRGVLVNYIFPLYEETMGSRIVIYGAGAVGKSYFFQLQKRRDISVCLWIDKEYRKYQEEGFPVEDCIKIVGAAYDYVILAVKNPMIMGQIRDELMDKGVEGDKIIWKTPIALIC